MSRFSFGEWVLIDGKISGQIIDRHFIDSWTVDVGGIWSTVDGERITKQEMPSFPDEEVDRFYYNREQKRDKRGQL